MQHLRPRSRPDTLFVLALTLLACAPAEPATPEFITPGETPTLKVGQQVYLKLADGDSTPVVWSSWDPEKVRISRDGVVTAVQITPGVLICAESLRKLALDHAIEMSTAARNRKDTDAMFSRTPESSRAELRVAQAMLDSLTKEKAALELSEDFEHCIAVIIVQ